MSRGVMRLRYRDEQGYVRRASAQTSRGPPSETGRDRSPAETQMGGYPPLSRQDRRAPYDGPTGARRLEQVKEVPLAVPVLTRLAQASVATGGSPPTRTSALHSHPLAQDSDAEEPDAEDSDAEDSDAEDSDAEDSDVEDSDTVDSEGV